MGLDLALLPVDGDHAPKLFFSHQILNLDRNAIIGDVREIADKHGKPLPCEFTTFYGRQENGEHGYGEEAEDPYGNPLQYVLAKHLKSLAKKVGVTYVDGAKAERKTAWNRVKSGDGLAKKNRGIAMKRIEPEDGYQSRKNQAAFAYICALPDEFKIVLYWH